MLFNLPKYHLQEYDTTPIRPCSASLSFRYANVISMYIYVEVAYCWALYEPDLTRQLS